MELLSIIGYNDDIFINHYLPMDCCNMFKKGKDGGSSSCGTYGLVAVGAAVYYIQGATSFWMGVLGVLKAMVWPAMLAYKVFEFFGM